jgi:hypothetical protein
MEKDMPTFVHELAAMIGEANALKLVTRYGGKTVRFQPARHDLKAIIGADATHNLIKHFGREEVSIPLCSAHLRNIRNATLRERFDTLTKTLSARRAVNALASDFSLTERRVWAILKKP